MNSQDLQTLGIPRGKAMDAAYKVMKTLFNEGMERPAVEAKLAALVAAPEQFLGDELMGALAAYVHTPEFVPREEPAPYRQWGDNLEPQSVAQMRNACNLPVAVAGALMPDAHLGYGLPIGGVLATENAVIPYAVGVDIACRMKMTVLDIPLRELDDERGRSRLTTAIEKETRFGVGASFKDKRQHAVMDADWNVCATTQRLKDKAHAQLGTSGSGNHFVEFGEFIVTQNELGLENGAYLALLSHSGSRGTGAQVCDFYSKLAMAQHTELPREMKHLAWLDMDSEEGQEYWAAMNLMGDYAAANHACIHEHIALNLRAEVMLDIENHHNFAWKEKHFGKDVIVHRKGATPAGSGVLGIIPGSMATSGFVVRGKGDASSLNSASHGAGRVMSRKRASKELNWAAAQKFLEERNVTLLSAGLDEVPMVYKDIHTVMAAQTDLVDVLGEFRPRLVKMAPAGERPED